MSYVTRREPTRERERACGSSFEADDDMNVTVNVTVWYYAAEQQPILLDVVL